MVEMLVVQLVVTQGGEELIDAIKTIAIILGIVFGLVALFRSKKADDSGDGQKMGMLMSEIGYVKSNTDEIKAEQQRQREERAANKSRGLRRDKGIDL